MRLPVLALTALLGVVVGCSSGDRGPGVYTAADVAAISFVGADSGDHLAATVTGDFDNDGRLDAALASTGGDGPDGDRSDAGEVRIVSDIVGLDSIVDLARPDDPPGAIFYGPFPGASLGRALAVGDFNGDSIDDLAMSAPLGIVPIGQIDSPGFVYIVFGRSGAPRSIDLGAGQADVELQGVGVGDGAGLTLAAADFDGDGSDDLVIGAHLSDGGSEGGRPDAGEAYVVRGGTLSPVIPLAARADTAIIGASAGDHLSEAMAVGDFNADGQLDLAIASTFAEVDGETQSGLTYVLSSPFAAGTFDLASAPPHFAIGGADAGDQMGHSIAAGDWDDDGVIDLWLGSVSADGENNAADLTGEARLFLIRPGQSGRIGADEAYGLMLGPSLGARLGRNAISAQLNTDPGAEVAIAATDVNDRRGAVYVVAADQPPPARADDAELTYEGRDEDDILGHEAFGNPSMNSVDLDDDDVSELIIAAPGSDGPDASRPDCGEVYVIVADAKG